MSWLYSQALVEEYLGDTCSDGEPSVQSNGNPTQLAYLPPDKMTDFSRVSRFGMTYRPLTEDRGEELLTSYLAAFHVKTFPQLAKEPELTESEAECGEKWHGSFTKYDPDSSMWKTHQCSLLGDLEPFLETWPRWGLMRDGECWEQQMSAHRTSVTESGLEPDNENFFHTPNTTGMDGWSNSRKALKKRMLPTPQASDYITKKTSSSWKAKGGVNFSLANPEIQRMWTTPTAHNAKETNAPSESKRNTPTLAAQVGGKLNPMWVEKLMGWPEDWTRLNSISHIKMTFWLMGFINDSKRCANEILRVLRQGVVQKEIQQSIGRFVSISEAAVLLSELCEHSNRPYEARIFLESKKALEEEMRGLRVSNQTTSAPHRSEQQEQRAREHSDTLQALSRLLAHYGKKNWKSGSWEDAVPRVENNVADRVDRLKAIGNGQVPLVAATAWEDLNDE